MAKQRAVTDEEIIAALLSSGTIKEAAAAVGLTQRTLYERMTDGEFQVLYKSARADILRQAVHRLNAHTAAAINTIAEVMSSEDTNPAIRLQAANALLTATDKFTGRLSAAEQKVINQKDSNDFWSV